MSVPNMFTRKLQALQFPFAKEFNVQGQFGIPPRYACPAERICVSDRVPWYPGLVCCTTTTDQEQYRSLVVWLEDEIIR